MLGTNEAFSRVKIDAQLKDQGWDVLNTNALPAAEQSAIRQQVETFTDFTADNDPHGERDFGAFEHRSTRIFWKIDYYAPDMEHGSENPADPKQTIRILTIMLASEY